jgi:ABC-type uncharacterized transport system permease subunit
MGRACKAAVAYFAIVFALGFVLGAVRVLVLAPRMGEASAVLLELPIMLLASWVASGWLISRFSVRDSWDHRLLMGGVAFVLLIAAELALSMLGFGRSAGEHFARYGQSAEAMLGLSAQVLFGLMPLLRPTGRRRAAAGDRG